MKKMIQFLREARAELRKVVWPSWDEITRSTVVVFITVILFTLFIYFLDEVISLVITKVLG
ncbi:MAG: preprotein translocase subunit SecE [Candidatus Hydrogenedentota bacterium]|nr:MAG: preprotein translocase subunit SecE [Candidatus Hydrogenedentota bacterium]